MVYIIVCANDNLLGVRFRPWPRPQRADAPEFVHPLIITHVRAHMFNHTRCNVCVYAMQCASPVHDFVKIASILDMFER